MLAALLVLLIGLHPLAAAESLSADDRSRLLAAKLFERPADRLTVAPSGKAPEVIVVEQDGVPVGYLASTYDVIGSVGYSGKPIDIVIAVDMDARIAGARLIRQSEPILTIGISEADIVRYVSSFRSIELDRVSANTMPVAISGATVSSGVIRDGIIRTARTVALAYDLLGSGTQRQIDRVGFSTSSWSSLIEDGALAHRLITLGDVRQALQTSDYKSHAGADDKLFAEMYYGLLTPPQIGQNLLGKRDFTALMSGLGSTEHAIVVAANGLYSFKGTRWRKTGVFDRLQLVQDNRTFRLTVESYKNVQRFKVDGAPEFREIAVFAIPPQNEFDPTRPWRLSLLVEHEAEDSVRLTSALPLHYNLPDSFTVEPAAGRQPQADAPLWQQNWTSRIWAIALLVVVLLVLAVILVFQDSLSSRIRLYRIVRTSFLLSTVIVLGLMLGAQLSVVHVLAFTQSIRTGFQWETFLLDPVIFILWSTVAVSLLFWGRGVFCGWLCPFGALQELLNMAAKRIGIRQIDVPFGLHERLWPIKYILFLGLFALSLHSIEQAFVLAEVEPFKTTMTMHFARSWPFIAYAAGLLVAGLFVERAYCRYLCPLGAALAIPARLRMFEWLKRRPQCGRECRICAVRCTVQAIHPDGHINPNECIHCLRCQTNYFDATTCPPLKAREQRRAAHRAARAAASESGSET